MKGFIKVFRFILTIALIVSILPATITNAAEKKYKLSLTGQYDLSDDDKVIYNYSKMMKNIKLEQVEGTNRWNLTMYAGTTACLPYTAVATTDKVKITSNSMYVSGNALYSNDGGTIKITAGESSYGLTKTVTNKVLTCKSYNEAGKGLSTLKIVVTILPYSAKLERMKPVTAEELYKLNYQKSSYSDFAWKNVVSKYPEVLLERYSPLYPLAKHATGLSIYERAVPQYLYDEFDTKDAEELVDILYSVDAYEVWDYDYELIGCALLAISTGYDRPGATTLKKVEDILLDLELEKYDTDWQKVLEIQKWVKANIKYKVVDYARVADTLSNGYGDCASYTQFMVTACQMIGVPCYIAENTVTANHAWNIVLVDGLWCTMDLTVGVDFFRLTGTGFTGSEDTVSILQSVLGGEMHKRGDGKVFDTDEFVWVEE